MGQIETLHDMDAVLHGAFAGAGLADIATYRAKDVSWDEPGIPVRVYVDRDRQRIGEFGNVAAPQTEIEFLHEDVTPAAGGRLVVDGERWVLQTPLSDDASLSRWVVRRG